MNIINKIEFENNCWVGQISPTFNLSEQDRFQVANVGSISKGKFESKNCEVRFNHFLTESGGSPSVPLEFVPIRVSDLYKLIFITKGQYPANKDINHNELLRYCSLGYVFNEIDRADYLHYYTNLRNLLKFGISLNQIPFNTLDEVKDFKIIVGRVPAKVISHLRTHRAFSWIIESSRSKNYKPEFWIPKEQEGLLFNTMDKKNLRLIDLMKNQGIKPEIANMEYSDRRLVHFGMAAWKNDSATFDNLFKVRVGKDTMDITSIVVDNIKKLVEFSL